MIDLFTVGDLRVCFTSSKSCSSSQNLVFRQDKQDGHDQSFVHGVLYPVDPVKNLVLNDLAFLGFSRFQHFRLHPSQLRRHGAVDELITDTQLEAADEGFVGFLRELHIFVQC